MKQDRVCFGKHSFADLRTCSGVGPRRKDGDGPVIHDKWDPATREWKEVSPGVEVCPVYSTELDASIDRFVAGYALRFKRVNAKIPKIAGERATLKESICQPSKLFQSPAKAAGYADVKDEAGRAKQRAHNARLDEKPDPLLGDRADRFAADRAYRAWRAGKGTEEAYNEARARLRLPG